MSYLFVVILLALIRINSAENDSKIDLIKERLEKTAKKSSLIAFSIPPEPDSYLNHDLVNNSPNKVNLKDELTQIIREWSPRLLALDPTSPYYYSEFNNIPSPYDEINLLSYLQAIELNQTIPYPFINVLPQSYRYALRLPSVFRCDELIYSTPNLFFHNIKLLIGPGKSEYEFEQQSNGHSHFYCSLYGSPYFILIEPKKQSTITYDTQTLLSQDDLSDINFTSTSLTSGTCLLVPSDWTVSIQFNNSILIDMVLNQIDQLDINKNDLGLLTCTHTSKTVTLDHVDFSVVDTFNVSDIALIVYFYQYLNPPMFDKEYDSEIFYENFREDKNVSQLIMKWTPELNRLIKKKLFRKLDINNDKIFNVNDYFDIKKSNLNQLQSSIFNILEELRQTILQQYNELNEQINKMTQQMANLDANTKEHLDSMIDNLPEQVKDALKDANVDVKEYLDKVKRKKSKRPSSDKIREKNKNHDESDSTIFDNKQDDNLIPSINIEEQDTEEEITAEPIENENQAQRTEL